MSTIRADLPSLRIRSGPTVAEVVGRVGKGVLVVIVLLGAFITYQFGITSLLASQGQTALRSELGARSKLVSEVPFSASELPLAPVEVPADLAMPDFAAEPTTGSLVVEPVPNPGEALGRIVSVTGGIDWVFVEGADRDSLKNGAGHMAGTALPGQPGNSVISGHRLTYGAPFLHLERLGPGDLITVETATGSHVYQVVETLVVRPGHRWVVEQWDGAWLTLTASHPLFSSSRRLVVISRLVAGPNAGAILGGQ